ncbi:hypothetical protein [Microcystis phage MinS1]|nr:hypothetical protein [Microcystis phage MinS1]
MDPALASVVVAFIASAGAVITAIITGRASAERVRAEDRIRRLEKQVTDLGGDPDD